MAGLGAMAGVAPEDGPSLGRHAGCVIVKHCEGENMFMLDHDMHGFGRDGTLAALFALESHERRKQGASHGETLN